MKNFPFDFLENLTIKDFHQGLINKEFSATEIAQAFFELIKKKDEKIGAYLRLSEETALEQARKIDAELSAGKKTGILTGVPLAIKDNILVKNEITTAGSRMLKNYQASYDATVIKKLKEAGAIFLGKTNLDEFAMGSSTEHSAFQTTRNPVDLERVPGGSSGGSAAAVAAGMALAALGSDTGGSIRQPASFCGVVGLKPTYGAVSRFGLIAMASSLDQIGPLTKTAEDAEIIFDAIKGGDFLDSTSVEPQMANGKGQMAKGKGQIANSKWQRAKGTIGLPKEYFIEGLDKETAKTIDGVIADLKKLNFQFKEVSLATTKHALSAYYIIMMAEASANLARYEGLRYSRVDGCQDVNIKLADLYSEQRSQGFGAEAKRRILLGSFVLSAGYYESYYLKAQKARRLIKEDFDRVFEEVDVLLTPVAPTPAFKIGEKTSDPLAMYLSDIFTIPVNLAGLPAVAAPAKIKNGLPIGFQLIGKPFAEKNLLEIVREYEQDKNKEKRF